MGMDGVEIVMAVEDAFDIRIENSEAEKLLTPFQLIELVQAKVANVETEICLSHRAFNLVRRYILQRFNLPRSEITPSTPLGTIVPKKERKLFLRDLSAELTTFKPPVLAVPRWLSRTLPVFIIGGGFASAWTMTTRVGFQSAAGSFVGGAIACGLLSIFAIKLLATEFPTGLSTIGDLALWVKRYKPDLSSKSERAWTREQIAARVREIVIDILACEKTYREDARFVQDLGLS